MTEIERLERVCAQYRQDALEWKDRADRISALAAAHIKTIEVERDTLRGRLSECEKDAEEWVLPTTALMNMVVERDALRERAKKAESESAQGQRMLRQAQDLAIGRASRLSRMTAWLELNQPDVFRRGLWDALAAPEGKQS